MKVFIRETEKTVTVRIYGISGRECTREFFKCFFTEKDGVHETSDDEKVRYGTDAEYSIETQEFYDFFSKHIDNIQNSIDEVALAIINGYTVEEFVFDGEYYAL